METTLRHGQAVRRLAPVVIPWAAGLDVLVLRPVESNWWWWAGCSLLVGLGIRRICTRFPGQLGALASSFAGGAVMIAGRQHIHAGASHHPGHHPDVVLGLGAMTAACFACTLAFHALQRGGPSRISLSDALSCTVGMLVGMLVAKTVLGLIDGAIPAVVSHVSMLAGMMAGHAAVERAERSVP